MQIGANLSSRTYVDGLLTILVKHVTHAARTAFCRIGLLSEGEELLSIRATYAVRELPWQNAHGERYRLDDLPKHRMAVETRQPVLVRQDTPHMAVNGEELHVLTAEVQSAALLPLLGGERVLGVLIAGEMRNWERSPFDAVKMGFLSSLALSIANTLAYVNLLHEIAQAYERFFAGYQQAIELERHRAMARLALTMVDEFAQPLTNVWGFTQLLLKDTNPADHVRYQSLLKIMRSCERMNTIVQNLRALGDEGLPEGREQIIL